MSGRDFLGYSVAGMGLSMPVSIVVALVDTAEHAIWVIQAAAGFWVVSFIAVGARAVFRDVMRGGV